MKRRLALSLPMALWTAAPARVRARGKPMPVIGILGEGYPEDPAVALNLEMLRRGLAQEDFVEDRNVAFDYRWAYNAPERLPKLARELVARPVDVLVNEGGTVTALEARKATSRIPIVFHASDALADGLVSNLARPGGNLTGVSQYATETITKGFQLLKELAPSASTIAFVSAGQAPALEQRLMEEVRPILGGRLRLLAARADDELEAAFARLAAEKAAAIVFANATYVQRMVGLAQRHRVPAAYNQRAYVVAGGLVSYGASIPAAYLIKGVYAGKILKGAKPGDLPVQQPSKFELALNLKTATVLGLAVPPAVTARADEVIE
jgi:putative tryptophan/tyrosine transport system substrate-binding protein